MFLPSPPIPGILIPSLKPPAPFVVAADKKPDQIRYDRYEDGVDPDPVILRDPTCSTECDHHRGTNNMDPKHPGDMAISLCLPGSGAVFGQHNLNKHEECDEDTKRESCLQQPPCIIQIVAAVQPSKCVCYIVPGKSSMV